jgi:hypothetical protein
MAGEDLEPRYCLTGVAFVAHHTGIECCSAPGGDVVHWADVDDDGDVDAISALLERVPEQGWNLQIAWHENADSLGTFSGPHSIGEVYGGRPLSIAAADLDADGDLLRPAFLKEHLQIFSLAKQK